MPPGAKVPCYCTKCNGILVSVRTERNHRNGPLIRQQNIRPAAGRKANRPSESAEPVVDFVSAQVALEEPDIPSSGISNHGDRNTLEDSEDYEMHGNDGGHADEHNVNL